MEISNSPSLAELRFRTPQSVIHIRHNISLRQYKYWLLLLRELRLQYENGIEADEEGLRYISLHVIYEYLGYIPKRIDIWNDLKSLKNETIALNILEKDGKPAMHGSGFIWEWRVSEGRVGFRLPTFLEVIVKNLDDPNCIFHVMNWSIFSSFSGKHEAIIYKLCRDYMGIGRTPYMSINAFRQYMGIQEDEYPNFNRFSQRVIYGPSKAINESEVSDLIVEPVIDRRGRKAIGLYFAIKRKPNSLLPKQLQLDRTQDKFGMAFINSRIEIPISKKNTYFEMRSIEEISLCIERANEYADKQLKLGKSFNYGAIYHSAIKEGWHAVIAERKATEKVVKERKTADQRQSREMMAAENARIAKSSEKSEAILTSFRALPDSKQLEIIEEFLSGDNSAKGAYKRKGFDSPLFLFPFIQHLKQTHFLDI